RAVNARLWRGDRHRHALCGLLALVSRRDAALAQPHSGCDRARLRAARIRLGWRLVSLRHHALRVPAGAVAVGWMWPNPNAEPYTAFQSSCPGIAVRRTACFRTPMSRASTS